MGGLPFGNKVCQWCVRHEAAQRGELPEDEMQQVMPAPWQRHDFGSTMFTQLFLGINVAVFLGMALAGISITDPTSHELIGWGANCARTIGGEWWRLLTCTFLHIGIIHIGFNMWCLWDLGQLAESLFGNWTFAIIYLTTGVAGSLASVIWNPYGVSAGASGAIFGIAGALISTYYLGDFSLPRSVIQMKLRSVIMFAGYNLVFGAMRSNTDNAAHIGGLVAGLIFGALIAKAAPDSDEPLPRVLAVLVVVLGVAGCGFWLHHSRAYLDHMKKANAFASQDKTADAIAEYEIVARQKPDYASAHYQLARLYLLSGQNERAEHEMKRWIEIVGNNDENQADIGYLYLEAKRAKQAQQIFTTIVGRNPNSAIAHYGLGQLAVADGNCETALAEFETARKIDSEYTGGQYETGTCYAKSKKYDEAISSYRKEQEISGDDSRTESALAEAYEAKGMKPEAEEARKKVEELKDTDVND
jgi:rhomboid protease GluP